MNSKNIIRTVLLILIVAAGIATTWMVKVNALDADEVILCVSVLETKLDNDLNCHIVDMKDVDMSDQKFVKHLFSHDDVIKPRHPDPNLEKASLK
jgi:hypothetical protein